MSHSGREDTPVQTANRRSDDEDLDEELLTDWFLEQQARGGTAQDENNESSEDEEDDDYRPELQGNSEGEDEDDEEFHGTPIPALCLLNPASNTHRCRRRGRRYRVRSDFPRDWPGRK